MIEESEEEELDRKSIHQVERGRDAGMIAHSQKFFTVDDSSMYYSKRKGKGINKHIVFEAKTTQSHRHIKHKRKKGIH